MKTNQISSNRIASIDVFRGLTILLMIFVNDVAGVVNIPGWLKHAPEGSLGMTFVDVVFPAFLFIVGLSIPFALAQRQKKHPERSVWLHIMIRTAGLIVLGLLMLNGSHVSSMNSSWWNVLMYLGAILFWTAWPSEEKNKLIFQIIKYLGLAILVSLLIVYRRHGQNGETWIITGWWGILGEIGMAYLCTAILYLLFKNKPIILYLIPALSILLYITDRTGQFDFLGQIKTIFYIGSHFGTHVLITISGLICGKWLFDLRKNNNKDLLKNMAIFALALALTGYLTYGLYGIDKIAATPSWALYSTVICILLFMLIYWLMDMRGYRGIYNFFKPVASNPLLAYLLHVMFIYIFRLIGISSFYGHQLGSGILGIVRSIVYTTFIYMITKLLTQAGIRLKL
jgi:heparan-alpha-glucosaminide N-acetyltransferase